MDYFPQALASGAAFCNRIEEQKRLRNNLIESRPTLLVSPRRYGKTSLALYTINKSKLHYAQFDFLSAVSIEDVEQIILNGIGKLINSIEKGVKGALKLATDLFAGLSIKLSSDALGLSVEINRKPEKSATSILSILERAEKLAKKYDEKIVLLFDEFQRVYQISNDYAVESVIRQVAQASKHLSFVFSGSNRHLLNQMFEDRNRPFYKLCDRMTLNRINQKDYIDYFGKVANKTGKKITLEAMETIFHYTKCHPYYINLLCSRLWNRKNITPQQVELEWHTFTFEERSQVANEIDLLSNSQRKLLVALSRSGGTTAPRSKEFQVFANMPGATIAQSLKFLERNDYVYVDEENTYRVLDPVIMHVLAA